MIARHLFAFAWLVGLTIMPSLVLAAEAVAEQDVVKLVVDPPRLELTGPASFRMLVMAETKDGWQRDVTSQVNYRILNTSFAEVSSGGAIRPLSDGETTVEISLGSHRVSVPLVLTHSQLRQPLHFENDLEPIFTRFNCNTSGCHGKAEGQNGFKLSVFGSDPLADYRAITMEARGRRVFPSSPDQSLLLQKASGVLPHGGGVRIAPESSEYKIMRDWIATGMPVGSSDAPRVVSVALSPRERRLPLEGQQTLRVVATWSDGRQQDVTPWARFQSNQEGLATVDENGLVTVGKNPGVVAVMASYMGEVDVFQVLIPRNEPLPASVTTEERNFIDSHVYRRLQQLHIQPAEVCTDDEFLRRAYLDLIGTLPTVAESRRFLQDTSIDRRGRLVNELLERPEFIDYWALKFADLLRVDRQALGHKAAYAEYRWIRERLASHQPLDQFARDILTAEGPLAENPQGNLFKVAPEAGQAASTISQIFLGVRIECAQCHHHPYDRWSQADYLGMSAYFAPLQRKNSNFGEWLLATGNPVTKHPRTGEAITAHPLGSPMVEKNAAGNRRSELATWLSAPENPFFARNWANRLWAHMLGRGLVEPVDDFRATNPPSNPALLDALAQTFVQQKFDLRGLLRTIANSRVYQQSSHPNATNARDEQNYSRFLLKRLDAEVLLDALSQVTGVPEKFEGMPLGTRAIQLWDSQVDHTFLRMFGRPMRQSVCECERVSEPSVAQVLHLLNGERLNEKLAREDGQVREIINRLHGDSGALVDELYLQAFSRFPTSRERNAAAERLQAAAKRDEQAQREAAEDLVWTMLNSLEFVFNH